MYKSIREIRREANVALSGRRGIYILMFTLSMAVSSALGASGLLSLIGTVLSVLFQVGMFTFLLKLCCGQKDQAQFNDLFYVFRTQNGEAGKSILLYLLQALYILPASIIYALLVMVFLFAESEAIVDLDMLATASLSIGSIIFTSLALIVFFIYVLNIAITYSMVFFILLDYPNLKVQEIWKRSCKILKGNRWRYVRLELGYMLWYIIPVAMLTTAAVFSNPLLVIPGVVLSILCTLYVTPSMHCARTLFYLDLVQHYANTKTVAEV